MRGKYNISYDIEKPYKKINTEYLMFDFNALIHDISSRVLQVVELKGDINKIMIKYIGDDLLYLIENVVNYNKIKIIYLAIDGTPSKAKMMEQRKRGMIGEIEKIIAEEVLKEKHSSRWSKNNIKPATNFMNSLVAYLKSEKYGKKIKELMKNNKNFKGFFISGPTEFGEGEKKIIDYINNNKIQDNITICSPDADMILLALLLLKDSKNILILRRDKQASEKYNLKTIFDNVYSIIDIDIFGKILFNIINKKIEKKVDINLVIKDVVLLFTFFGDDFLPKLESITVDDDTELILDLYSLTYKKLNEYLIKNEKINLKFYKYIINELSKYENDILERNYIKNKYRNYRWMKEQIEKENNIKLNHKQFIYYIKTYNFYRLLDKKDINKLYKFDLHDEINYPSLKEIDVIINNNISYNDLIKKTDDNKKNLIHTIQTTNKYPSFKNYIPENKKYKTIYKNYIGLIERSKTTKNDFRYKKLSDKDKIKFKLDKFLDEFYYKFNKTDFIKLGFDKNGKEKFYNFYFKNKKKDDIVKDYLEGLYWINEYYFNDRLCISWFYKNSKAPFLQDINSFLQKGNYNFSYIEKKFNYNESLYNFFTNLEQLLFITPFNINDIDNDKNFELINYLGDNTINKIKKFILDKDIKPIYFDFKQIVSDILKNKNKSLYCINAGYIARCYLKETEILYNYDDKIFINKFRKIINYDSQKDYIDIDLIDVGLFYSLINKKKYNSYIKLLYL